MALFSTLQKPCKSLQDLVAAADAQRLRLRYATARRALAAHRLWELGSTALTEKK